MLSKWIASSYLENNPLLNPEEPIENKEPTFKEDNNIFKP